MEKTLAWVVKQVGNYGFSFEKYAVLPSYDSTGTCDVAVVNYGGTKYAIWQSETLKNTFRHIKLKKDYEATEDPYLRTGVGFYALHKTKGYYEGKTLILIVSVTFHSIFDEVVRIKLKKQDEMYTQTIEIKSSDREVLHLAFLFCQDKCPTGVLLDKIRDKHQVVPIM